MAASALLAILASSSIALGSPVKRQDGPAIVDFSQNTGTPKHLASGILYGLPDDQNQIPRDLLAGFGFNYCRAAGAQVGNGWSVSRDAFQSRFQSALSNYQLTRSFGGGFVLLLNDLWGFDTTQTASQPGPGDNGDWTEYDAFLDAIIDNINTNNMQDGLVIDIWNEPELDVFWGRSVDQWLQMWGRGYYRFREAFGDGSGVRISGPATSGAPSADSEWFGAWARFVAGNQSVPDQCSWHEERGGSASVADSANGLSAAFSANGLPEKEVNINEYAIKSEQVPAGSAWFIAQLERLDYIGLRGNWASTTQLHDLAANLLSKTNPDDPTGTGYFPNGDYQVYKYYAGSMTGNRVSTSSSADQRFDAYATVDGSTARILMGVRPPTTGEYQLQMNGLSSLGLPDSGTLSVKTLRFPVGANEDFDEVDGPVDEGTIDHQYSDGTLTLAYYAEESVTFAWEFSY